jgi:hypothetical protein
MPVRKGLARFLMLLVQFAYKVGVIFGHGEW